MNVRATEKGARHMAAKGGYRRARHLSRDFCRESLSACVLQATVNRWNCRQSAIGDFGLSKRAQAAAARCAAKIKLHPLRPLAREKIDTFLINSV